MQHYLILLDLKPRPERGFSLGRSARHRRKRPNSIGPMCVRLRASSAISNRPYSVARVKVAAGYRKSVKQKLATEGLPLRR
jgi:hypothetical protein